jgi:hypothetical protein
MPTMNRITGSNYEDSLKSKLVNQTVYHESFHSRIFHFGQVINNVDPQNLSRIKIRIPIIDDVFYVNNSKEDGDIALPWSLPISHRFIDIPEVNSIIIVSILDPNTPYYGRVYFDCVTELSTDDIFSRTTPEDNSLSDWTNVEKAFKISLNSKPLNENAYNATANIDYRVGIRGKGNNKFELLQTSSTWSQNEGTDSLSYITLTNNIDIQAANNINILSTAGYQTHYNPVFHTPLYNYLRSNFQMLQKIVILLTTYPALSPDGPCMPAPNASQLINALSSLATDYETLKKTGNSTQIFIN